MFKEEMVVICVFVDDCLLKGNRTAIDAGIAGIEAELETRRLVRSNECIGCVFVEMPDGSKKLMCD
jgi:hypothetical protein